MGNQEWKNQKPWQQRAHKTQDKDKYEFIITMQNV
jgi:hypothetical protein